MSFVRFHTGIWRRVNFYAICLAFGVSVLLILAGSRFTDNTSYYHLSIGSRRHDRNLLTVEYGVPLVQHIGTLAINTKEILEKTRSNIKNQLSEYNFTESGAYELKDFIMESGGQPMRSLIISTWRSGSSFLAELLNAIPGTYYHYEPLRMYGIIQIRGPPESEEALNTIKAMFKCNYKDLEDYFDESSKNLNPFKHNTRLWEHCKSRQKLCLDAQLTSQLCKLFPFQIMKVVRLRLQFIQEILDDEELNVKVILLIRDPRGVMQSRQHRKFCKTNRDCWQPYLVCEDMISDYMAAGRIKQQYPDKLMVLQFEKLALKPNTTTHQILKFLRLSATQSIRNYLQTHTNKHVAGVDSTFRISRDVPFKWMNLMDFDYVDKIQIECKEAMFLWDYKMVHNESHMKSRTFNPYYSLRG